MTATSGDLRRVFALSEIFAHGFGVIISIALVLTLAPEKARLIPRLLSCLLLSFLSVSLIKHLVIRRRPQHFVDFPESQSETWWGLVEAGGWNSEFLLQSFPSGHSATAFCLALVLGWLFPRGRYLFLILALLAMGQRIMFQAHWASDVLFGAAIATMVVGNVLHAPLSDYTFGWIEKSKRTHDSQAQ